jgi:hypothetical protein
MKIYNRKRLKKRNFKIAVSVNKIWRAVGLSKKKSILKIILPTMQIAITMAKSM